MSRPIFGQPCKQHPHDVALPLVVPSRVNWTAKKQFPETPFQIPPGKSFYRTETDPTNPNSILVREGLEKLHKKYWPNSLWVYTNISGCTIHCTIRRVARIEGHPDDPQGGNGGGFELLIPRKYAQSFLGRPASSLQHKFTHSVWVAGGYVLNG